MTDAASTAKLTAARRRALEVLLAGEDLDVPVYESNYTTDLAALPDFAPPHERTSLRVYWQSQAWLTKNGLATTRLEVDGKRIRLTEAGRELARMATRATDGG